MKQYIIALALVSTCSVLSATSILISDMNADVSGSLEGSLSGSGTNGSSAFDIDSTPSVDQVASTFADYTVTGVDIDGNASFTENFSFRITFSSPDDINFSTTLETMGLGDDELISLNESFTMTISILSDSSATHDVTFDGMTAVDFISMSETDLSIVSSSGNSTVTLAGGSTPLGGTFFNPTFTYANTGDVSNSGTFEDWNLQFSTSPVPEPNTYALLAGISALGFVMLRRRG